MDHNTVAKTDGLKKIVLCNPVQAGWRSGGPEERGGGGRFDREYTNGVGGPDGPPDNPRWKQEPDYRMGRGGGSRGGHRGGFGGRPPPGSRYGRDQYNLPEWATSDEPGVERGGTFDADGKFKASGGRTLSGGERPRQSSKRIHSNFFYKGCWIYSTSCIPYFF